MESVDAPRTEYGEGLTIGVEAWMPAAYTILLGGEKTLSAGITVLYCIVFAMVLVM